MGPIKIVEFDSLNRETQELIRKSISARDFSYSPYSNFKVGAGMRCIDGSIYTGCNVENVSYSVAICAERTAIAKAVSEGKIGLTAVCVIADKVKGEFTSPCGMCRQAIVEFCDSDIPVYLSTSDMKHVQVTSMMELLPFAFKPGSLSDMHG